MLSRDDGDRYTSGVGVDGCCRAGCRDVVDRGGMLWVEATNLPRLKVDNRQKFGCRLELLRGITCTA
jgi:hypothetical protein